MTQLSSKFLRLAAAALLATAGSAAQAADISISGYGTVGYAKSDSSVSYQRDINSAGSFKRDTIFGAQMNAQFTPEWSATLQGKVARAPSVDHVWQTSLPWAFLSYRPTDDFLLRFGKLRIPFYMESENADVGETFAQARLPAEIYASTPTTDFKGASFSKSWLKDAKEWTLDGYWGKTNSPWRLNMRDPNNGVILTGAAGDYFLPLITESKGLRLTLQEGANTFLGGVHFAKSTDRYGKTLGPDTFMLAPAAGCTPINVPPAVLVGNYYCPSPNLLSSIDTTTINLGTKIDLGHGFRANSEYVRQKNFGTDLSSTRQSIYLTLLKDVGAWTPYVTYSKIRSKNLDLYQAVNSNQVQALLPIPALVAAIPQINAYQRVLADVMTVHDTYSWAVGTSYALNRNSKLKAEWSVVQTGVASSFVSAPGGETGHKRINVMSFSYNFTF